MLLIWRMHGNLIVSRISIHERHGLVSGSGIYELIDPRQRKTVFWACFVEISIVNTRPPFPIGFRNEDWIGYPRWIVSIPYKFVFDEPVNLFLQSLLSLVIKRSSFLLLWRVLRIDVQYVADDVGVDPNHIRM